ncbi:Branched-chain-amino-acid aminotransferase [Planctomycetes bacterium Pla163]|uniref:branched-chain-amino-acid transaminase n=1 Tax=Rohdeia mirabilis TaxID=2528008 RepID=A0A518CZT7_9BACT|nr:Branched-chain-amino-acid aminotransferase [Planctomycetes bacterium Pla163]
MSADPRERWVVLGGQVVAVDEARIDPRDPAVTGGAALLETFAVVGGSALLFEQHLERLNRSEAELGWARTPAAAVRGGIEGLLAACGVDSGALRLVRSPGPPGGPDTVLLGLRALPEPPAEGLDLVVDDGTWAAPSGFDGHKHTGRLARTLLRERARQRGAWDALLVGRDGAVLEATCANLVVVGRDGLVRTPPLEHGVLPGVVRQILVDAGEVQEGRLLVSHLSDAREVLLTSSLIGCRGARRLFAGPQGPKRELPGAEGSVAIRLRARLGVRVPG